MRAQRRSGLSPRSRTHLAIAMAIGWAVLGPGGGWAALNGTRTVQAGESAAAAQVGAPEFIGAVTVEGESWAAFRRAGRRPWVGRAGDAIDGWVLDEFDDRAATLIPARPAGRVAGRDHGR